MHFNKKENFTSNKKIVRKLLKETNKENDFFLIHNFFYFLFLFFLCFLTSQTQRNLKIPTL